MTLRLRFLLSLLAVIAIMAMPAIYGVTRVIEVRDIAFDLREQAASTALAVGRLGTAIEQLDLQQRNYVAFAQRDDAILMWNRLNDATAEIEQLRDGGFAGAVAEAAVPIAKLREVTTRLDSLVAAGELDAATIYRGEAAAPLIQAARDAAPRVALAIDRHTAASVATVERSTAAATTAAATAFLVALVLAAVLAAIAAGLLSSPLHRLSVAMARVADGAFAAPPHLPYDREDEVGILSRSFRAMTSRLAHLDRMKAEFVGAASHGLKTPIGVIGGYAELIRDEADADLSPRLRQLIDAMAEQTEVLRRRLDQLLEMSRMESGALTVGVEEIYLRHFVADLEREYAPKAASHQVDLRVRLDDRTPPFIFADPDLLRFDILANVIGNAIRYTPPGGSVDIAVRPDGELVIIEVTDSGPGIPESLITHIFEKYAPGRDTSGSGFGLPIAKAAVVAHGGRIDAVNLRGGGARFRISLPATQSSRLPDDDPQDAVLSDVP